MLVLEYLLDNEVLQEIAYIHSSIRQISVYRPIRPAREKYNVKPHLSCANVSSAGYQQCLFCLCVHITCILSAA